MSRTSPESTKPPRSSRRVRASEPVTAPATELSARYEPTHDEIARRAYELYLHRGCAHGAHEQDWQRAEAELRGS